MPVTGGYGRQGARLIFSVCIKGRFFGIQDKGERKLTALQELNLKKIKSGWSSIHHLREDDVKYLPSL